ncbi:MAG: J domain-containing protein [Actinomycetes bacterium]
MNTATPLNTENPTFQALPGLFAEPDPTAGPYAVLGLTRVATWKEISTAHRRLLSELHPDRHVEADQDLRDLAERRVRDVNEAFATIRRQRSGKNR